MSCDICTEKFNKNTRANITCSCEFSACKTCWKSYLLTIDEPGCMSPKCNVKFDRAFIFDNFDNKFIANEYKAHREEVLFNSEKKLFPETLMIIERRKLERQRQANLTVYPFRIKTIKYFVKELTMINYKYSTYNFKCPILKCGKPVKKDLRCAKCNLEIDKHFNKINEDRINKILGTNPIHDLRVIFDLQDLVYNKDYIEHDKLTFNLDLLFPMYNLIINLILIDRLHAEQFSISEQRNAADKNNAMIITARMCPSELCKGLLNEELICSLCNTLVCGKCHEENTTDHICNKDTIETIALLSNDSKACPGCSVPIFKSVGCDNMYCTNCKVFFRWDSGRIINRIVHNPEHSAEMRQRTADNFVPRNPGDILCGRELDVIFRQNMFHTIMYGNIDMLIEDGYEDDRGWAKHVPYMKNRTDMPYINAYHVEKIMRRINYIREYVMREFHIDNNATTELRISYLLNVITKKTYMINLQQIEKKYQKHIDFSNIFNTYISCVIDIFYRLYEAISETKRISVGDQIDETIDEIFDELEAFRVITNINLKKTAKVYNCVVYRVTYEYHYMSLDQRLIDAEESRESIEIQNEKTLRNYKKEVYKRKMRILAEYNANLQDDELLAYNDIDDIED